MAICVVFTGNNFGVNVRATKSTSSTRLGVIDNGVTVNVVRCDATWATLMYNGTPAFVQHQYLQNPPSSNGDGLSEGDSVTCNANSVNIRAVPGGNTTGRFINKGSNITVSGKASNGGYYWYQIGIGQWVRGDFLAPGTGTGVSGTESLGSSDDFTDIVNTNPTVNTHYTFYPANAVEYAKTHSSNNTGVADPKRNTSFREGASNSCANFVHQCLLAGGARMFDGWCFTLTGIPSSWNSNSWTYTNKGRRRLLEKKWITRVPNHTVQAGDIIYTYRTDYVSKGLATPFQHVTIAITDYDASINGCYVCGHTLNQNNQKKTLPTSGTVQAYCYRVKASLGGDGNEKAIDLTNGNSHAI